MTDPSSDPVGTVRRTTDTTIIAIVAEFCAEREQYITAITNCPPGNRDDYCRWQGHVEARRQLSERLALSPGTPAATATDRDELWRHVDEVVWDGDETGNERDLIGNVLSNLMDAGMLCLPNAGLAALSPAPGRETTDVSAAGPTVAGER